MAAVQGRAYVFSTHLCFTSNPLFGYIKKKVIPFEVSSCWVHAAGSGVRGLGWYRAQGRYQLANVELIDDLNSWFFGHGLE